MSTRRTTPTNTDKPKRKKREPLPVLRLILPVCGHCDSDNIEFDGIKTRRFGGRVILKSRYAECLDCHKRTRIIFERIPPGGNQVLDAPGVDGIFWIALEKMKHARATG